MHIDANKRSHDFLPAESDAKKRLQKCATSFIRSPFKNNNRFVKMVLGSVEKGEIDYAGGTKTEGIRNALKHKDEENANVLHYAGAAGDEILMRFLLKKTRETECKELINSHKSDGDTPLHVAAEEGYLKVVMILCRYGAKIDSFNRNHETPVFVAAKNNHHEVVQYLVGRNKEAIDKRDSDGWSPLLIAASCGHIESADVLLNNGVEINTSDKNDQNVGPDERKVVEHAGVYLNWSPKAHSSIPKPKKLKQK